MAQSSYIIQQASSIFQRSAPITMYTVGQIVGDGNLRVFSAPDRNSYLRRVYVSHIVSGTAPTFRLYLFSSDPTGLVTAPADYATPVISTAAFQLYEGYVDIPTAVGGGVASGNASTNTSLVLPKAAAGSYYGFLTTQTMYVPTASANTVVKLGFEYSN